MKILKRDEKIIEENRYRKEQIDEGVALAKSRDILMKEVGELELQRASKIEDLKKSLKDEIEPLKKQKEILQQEVDEARIKLITLKKPLDDEWEEVKKEQDNNRTNYESLNIKEKTLISYEDSLKLLKESIEKEKRELKVMSKITNENHVKSKEDKLRIEVYVAEKEKYLISREDKLQDIKKNIDKKEKDLSFKETDLVNREVFLSERSDYLDKREKIINDKYETLQRTITRLNK